MRAVLLTLGFAFFAFRASAANLEYRTTVNTSADLSAALRALDFQIATVEFSTLAFYDTPDLRLLNAGLVMFGEHREVKSDRVVVRAYSVRSNEVDTDLFKMRGFSCQVDAIRTKIEPSCQLVVQISKRALGDVATGRRDITSILSVDQELFANDFGGYERVSSRVTVLGPVGAWRWSVVNSAGRRFDCELWSVGSTSAVLEVSVHGALGATAQLSALMTSFLAERGLREGSLESRVAVILHALTSGVKSRP